jgi:hypothetical protein
MHKFATISASVETNSPMSVINPLYFVIDTSETISSPQLSCAAGIVGDVIANARANAHLLETLQVSLLCAAATTTQTVAPYPLGQKQSVSIKRGKGGVDLRQAMTKVQQCIDRDFPEHAQPAVIVVLTTTEEAAALQSGIVALDVALRSRIICIAIRDSDHCVAVQFSDGHIWEGPKHTIAAPIDLAEHFPAVG